MEIKQKDIHLPTQNLKCTVPLEIRLRQISNTNKYQRVISDRSSGVKHCFLSSDDVIAWNSTMIWIGMPKCYFGLVHIYTHKLGRPLKLDKRNRIMLVDFCVFKTELTANQGVEQSRNTPELTIHVIKRIRHKFQHDCLSCHTSRIIKKFLADKKNCRVTILLKWK